MTLGDEMCFTNSCRKEHSMSDNGAPRQADGCIPKLQPESSYIALPCYK